MIVQGGSVDYLNDSVMNRMVGTLLTDPYIICQIV